MNSAFEALAGYEEAEREAARVEVIARLSDIDVSALSAILEMMAEDDDE
jgi:hypothetical protein